MKTQQILEAVGVQQTKRINVEPSFLENADSASEVPETLDTCHKSRGLTAPADSSVGRAFDCS